MILSILTNIDGYTKYLYDSVTQKVLMVGTDEQVSAWKHDLEQLEQQKLNDQHFDELRKEYTEKLVKAGNSKEKAENFLKEKMPFLFKEKKTEICDN
ncbi:MAG: hypothetical protein KBA90_14330 [Chitinophagaceae bacterium]|nr:hypothetical protein [Chitinophagaceae bacterium]